MVVHDDKAEGRHDYIQVGVSKRFLDQNLLIPLLAYCEMMILVKLLVVHGCSERIPTSFFQQNHPVAALSTIRRVNCKLDSWEPKPPNATPPKK